MKKLKNNKKGFTLVEIIVVIVILAVLMAVAVPSVLGYISEADNAKLMAQARSVLTSTQAGVVKEQVSSDGLTSDELTALPEKIKKASDVDAKNITIYSKVVMKDDKVDTTNSQLLAAKSKDQVAAVSMTIGGKTVTAVTNDKVYVAD